MLHCGSRRRGTDRDARTGGVARWSAWWRRAIAVAVACATTQGCTPVVIGSRDIDTDHVVKETRSPPLPATRRIEATVSSVGARDVKIGLARTVDCEVLREATAHRVREVERAWDQKSKAKCKDPDTWLIAVATVIGFPIAVAACLGGMIRARSYTEDVGRVSLEPERTVVACDRTPLAGVAADLRFPSGASTSARSGADGVAQFEVLDVSAGDLENRTAQVHVGDQATTVGLGATEAAQLLARLRADRRSRIAREWSAERVSVEELLHGR